MSLCENFAQNVAQLGFCQNEYTTCTAEKSRLKLCVNFVIKKKPIGENSPNPVTLSKNYR
jgi:hypothetical protein